MHKTILRSQEYNINNVLYKYFVFLQFFCPFVSDKHQNDRNNRAQNLSLIPLISQGRVPYLISQGRLPYLISQGRVPYLISQGRVPYLISQGRLPYLISKGRFLDPQNSKKVVSKNV